MDVSLCLCMLEHDRAEHVTAIRNLWLTCTFKTVLIRFFLSKEK